MNTPIRTTLAIALIGASALAQAQTGGAVLSERNVSLALANQSQQSVLQLLR